jgi:peroxiredoxin
MKELVQLDQRHEDFERRNVRVIVVSMEKPEDARQTQQDFPHLVVLADHGQEHGLSEEAKLIDTNDKAPNGDAIDAPTTILVDRHGTVRWLFRPNSVITRLSPDEVLQAVDQHMAPK